MGVVPQCIYCNRLCLTIGSRTELYRIEPITIWEEARNHGFWLGLALGLGSFLLAVPLYWLARRRRSPRIPSAQGIHEQSAL